MAKSPWWARLQAVMLIVMPVGAFLFLLAALHHATQALETPWTPP